MLDQEEGNRDRDFARATSVQKRLIEGSQPARGEDIEPHAVRRFRGCLGREPEASAEYDSQTNEHQAKNGLHLRASLLQPASRFTYSSEHNCTSPGAPVSK